jgi:hypothetical protein
MLAGVINWDRVHRYRRGFEARGDEAWPAEMKRVAQEEAWRFHDRIMLTCDRPYSGVSAAELGLAMSEQEWLSASSVLRLEHEFTHYATKRIWGTMSLNLLDETLCDFMGMTLALGAFRAEHFLRFMGLEAYPTLRADGRLGTYTAELTAGAAAVQATLAVHAARRLERLAEGRYDLRQRQRLLLALAPLPLEAHAAAEADELFAASWEAAGQSLATAAMAAR